MSTATEQLFSKIETSDNSQRAKSYPEYRKLLGALVDGEEVDAAKARKVIDKMGKSQAEVDADVNTLRKRFDALSAQEDLEQKYKASREAELKLAEHSKAKEAYLEQWKLDWERLNSEVNIAQNIASKADSAKRFLTQSVLDPTIELELVEIDAEAAKLHEVRNKLEARIRSFQREIVPIRTNNQNSEGKLPKLIAEDIAKLEAKIADTEAELLDIASQREELQQRRDKVSVRAILEA